MMWWGHEDWNWWAWLLMSFGMIAFWALVAWVIVTIVRQPRPPGSGTPDAEAILRERFARGEIDEDEYRKRLQALRDVGHATRPHGGS